jgi:hypothetical protein
VNYTIRQTPLAKRGRANVQVSKQTRDEIKRLAQERNISMGAMVDRLIKYWNNKAKEENSL